MDVHLAKHPGRPVEKLPEEWMYKRMQEIAAMGRFVSRCCVEFKISRDTYYRWLTIYPEFHDAHIKAECVSQDYYEGILHHQAITGQGNITATAMVLNNHFKRDYQRNTSGSNGGNTVNINNMNAILTDGKTIEQLTEDLVERLDRMGIKSIDELKQLTYDNDDPELATLNA